MTPIEWLEHRVPGFAALTGGERRAIFEFAILWSVFEGRALDARASATRIVEVVQAAEGSGRLDLEPFQPHLEYFCARYFGDGQPSPHFMHLNLRAGDRPELVVRVLKRDPASDAECVAALLIVVYRFRNNLFHGLKWAYELKDQQENFEHANVVLTSAYDQIAP
jgi:hypothetical protein